MKIELEAPKVWTANDTRNDWLLAKFWFRNADAQVTSVITYFQENIHGEPEKMEYVRKL